VLSVVCFQQGGGAVRRSAAGAAKIKRDTGWQRAGPCTRTDAPAFGHSFNVCARGVACGLRPTGWSITVGVPAVGYGHVNPPSTLCCSVCCRFRRRRGLWRCYAPRLLGSCRNALQQGQQLGWVGLSVYSAGTASVSEVAWDACGESPDSGN
jgi:hypothetical protein